MWAISNAILDKAKALRQTGIKTYWKRAGQVEI